MYPPVAIGQIRVNARRDVVLAGRLTLPRGTAVWVPHAALHMAAFNWAQPEAFLPGPHDTSPAEWPLRVFSERPAQSQCLLL